MKWPIGYLPIGKVYGGGAIGGALAIAIAWAWQQYTGEAMSKEVAIAWTTVLIFAFGYIIPLEKKIKQNKQE